MFTLMHFILTHLSCYVKQCTVHICPLVLTYLLCHLVFTHVLIQTLIQHKMILLTWSMLLLYPTVYL